MTSTPKKKILINSTSFPRSKTDFDGFFIFEMANRLSKTYDVTVLAPHCQGSLTREIWNDFKVYRFRYAPSFLEKICYGPGILPNIKSNKFLILALPFLFIFQFFALLRVIRKEKIDLINAHWVLPSGLLCLLVSKIMRKSLVLTTHGPDVYTLVMRKGILGAVSRYVVRATRSITATSAITAKLISEYAQISLDRIKVISMGVDESVFRPSDDLKRRGEELIEQKLGFMPSRPIIMIVAALAQHKGIHFLIKAMADVVKKNEQASLLVIGTGQEEASLKKLTRELNLEKNIFFLGGIVNKELPCYYNLSDLFVLASLREGLPVVLMEAMACAKPVIATNIAGNPDLIKSGESGILIDTADPRAISQAILEILSDPKKGSRFGQQARQTIVQRFGWAVIINRFEELFNEQL